MSDSIVRELVQPVKNEITEFISNALQDSQPRDDCREVLELASTFWENLLPEVCISLLQVQCIMHDGWQRFFIISRFGCSGHQKKVED